MQIKPQEGHVTKIGGSLYMWLPAWFMKQVELEDGTEFIATPQADGSILIKKVEKK